MTFSSSAVNLVPADTNQAGDAFVRDRLMKVTTRLSVTSGGVQANGDSYAGPISADGALVTLGSVASNLVPGDTNARWDVFVQRLAG